MYQASDKVNRQHPFPADTIRESAPGNCQQHHRDRFEEHLPSTNVRKARLYRI